MKYSLGPKGLGRDKQGMTSCLVLRKQDPCSGISLCSQRWDCFIATNSDTCITSPRHDEWFW